MDGGVGKLIVTSNFVPQTDLTFHVKTFSGTAVGGAHFASIDSDYVLSAGTTSLTIPLVSFYEGSLTSHTLTAKITATSEGAINTSTTTVTINPLSIPENELSGALAIGAGSTHSCATFDTGKILCWGVNDTYQLGLQSPPIWYSDVSQPSTFAPPTRVLGVASGATQIKSRGKITCVMYFGGSLYCWGDNAYSQIQNPASVRVAPPVQTSTVSTDFSIGYYSICIILADGTLQCRGDNNAGEIGDGTTSGVPVTTFTTASAVSGPVSKVAVGRLHACAILQTGGVECWGYNAFGETGNGNTLVTIVTTPITPAGLASNVVDLSTEGDYSCALLSTGTVKCWGYDPLLGVIDTPTDVSGMPMGVVEIAVGQLHACARTSAGEIWCWGSNANGQLGDGTYTNSSFPVKVAADNDDPAITISAGAAHTCAILQSGKPICWGSNVYSQVGKLNRMSYQAPIDVQHYQGVSLSDFKMGGHANGPFGCALKSNGAVECLGSNSAKQLGAGSVLAQSAIPLSVTGLTAGTTSALVVGQSFACALLADTGVSCWGDNTYNQIGNGGVGAQVDPAQTPTGLSSGNGAQLIKGGFGRTCVLTATDTLTCWGLNTYGELGTCAASTTPVAVAGTANTVDFAVGGYHNCLIDSSGNVKCWGNNDYGQLGLGTYGSDCQTTPLNVSLPEKATALALGVNFSCASTESGKLYCWGANGHGQVGVGTYVSDYANPQLVSNLSGKVKDISAGYEHMCALLTTGEVECWGNNFFNQLGKLRQSTSALEDRKPAKVELLLTGVEKLRVGEYTSCAIVTGGYVKCWGADYPGYLRFDLYFPNKPRAIYAP